MRTVNEALKIAQQVTGYELKEYQQQAAESGPQKRIFAEKMVSFLRLRGRAKA